MDFRPQSVHFRREPPSIVRKHIPSGMGTESLGVIGCIFAENGPLECRIESSFSGTGWGAKGDFRWIFGPNPCIFEGGPHHFPKAQPSGMLRVISDGFLAPIRVFSKGAPHHFPKANALRYGHRKFGSDRMYIRGEWALRVSH